MSPGLTTERVYKVLKIQIMHGQRMPGERLDPARLASELNSSATPVRDALHRVLAQLQFGQVLLASIGSTSPFIGLFGTVWGIYHALLGISSAGSMTIERVAGPVGEALVMTAAGLAVAIPAVLAYNWFGRVIGRIEAELEGFAHDLLAVFAARATAAPPAENQLLARHLQCRSSMQLAKAVAEALHRYAGSDPHPLEAPSELLPPLM